jgi:predicted GIY-YIG superfamily endonuclease
MATEDKLHYCYILYNDDDSRTYNGYTTNLKRRLRQHNQEISGGAKATGRNKNKNWKYGVIITSKNPDFTKTIALKLEWQIRYPTRRVPRPKQYNGIQGRIDSLPLIFKNERFCDIMFEIYTDLECLVSKNIITSCPNLNWTEHNIAIHLNQVSNCIKGLV